MWEIYDRIEKRVIGRPYRNRARARLRVDVLDNEYGAYRYMVRLIPETPPATAIDHTITRNRART